jgi:hypothetical protein
MLIRAISWAANKTGIGAIWIKAGLIAVVLSAATAWHLDAVHDARTLARETAVAECNTTQLEEELRLANVKAEAADARANELAGELADREREARERDAFIHNLQSNLNEFEDDSISERTRAFMTILSNRSSQYYEDDNEE